MSEDSLRTTRARRLGADVLRLASTCTLLVITAAVVLALRVPRPFLLIWLTALPLCVFGGVRSATAWGRQLFLVGFGLAMGLGLVEGAFVVLDKLKQSDSQVSGTYNASGYFVEGGPLGYAPLPGSRVTSRKTLATRIVYDAVYTISGGGVRATKGNPKGDTWLFTGCSVMFGEGVNDDETLPAYFSAALDYQANVVNLGFHGYGPHQMLRSIETDLFRPLLHGVVKQVIYEGIWSHPWRAAGHDSWDVYGPRYVLSGDGVTYAGPFHDRVGGFILKVLRRSDFFQFVLDRTLFRMDVTNEDVERYARILERSAKLAFEKYGAGFTVVYWDDENPPSRRVLERLRKTALPLVLVSDVIPRREWKNLALPGDPHPKPEANRRLAAALAGRFQGRPPTRP